MIQQLKNIKKTRLIRDVVSNISPYLVFLYFFVKYTFSFFDKGGLVPAILAAVGIFAAIHGVLVILHTFYVRQIRPPYIKLSSFSGKWAIITGASSAIGSEFCFQLAASGMNILMIGQNKERLEQIATYMKDSPKYNHIHTRILHHDFADSDTEANDRFYKTLHAKCSKLVSSSHHGIGLLVNCTNWRNPVPSVLHEIDPMDVQKMIKSNIGSMHDMVHAVLPYMIQQGPNFGSAIITVSSHGVYHPTPMMSLYTATNAYRTEFSKNLYEECKRHGIEVLSITPELMSSNVPRRHQSESFVKAPSAQKVAKKALSSLGYQSESFPFLGHAQSTYIPMLMWRNPWGRFLNKMKQTRSEILSREYEMSLHGKVD